MFISIIIYNLNIYFNSVFTVNTNVKSILSLRIINPNTLLLLNFVELFTTPSYVS